MLESFTIQEFFLDIFKTVKIRAYLPAPVRHPPLAEWQICKLWLDDLTDKLLKKKLMLKYNIKIQNNCAT